jgi:hypothetical protein
MPHSIPYVLKKLYDEDVIRVIKPMGEVFDKQVALEIVDHLISLGQTAGPHTTL